MDVSGAGTFSVTDTKHASWPWSKQPLTAKGVRLGYLTLCTVFGVAFAALGFIESATSQLFGGDGYSKASIEDQNIAQQLWSAQNYSWIVMLIFTPLVLDLVGGPKNGTVICLFSWAVCSSLFIMTWFVRTEPAKWACAIITGVVSGITAPLAFTGTEVYTERAAVLLAREEFAEAEKKEDPTVASAEATPKSLSKNIVARRKREGELVDRMVGVLFGISQIFTVIFQIPSAAGLMSDPYTYDTLWSLVGFTCCIFLFFLVSLMIPNIPSQDHGEKSDKEEEGKKRNCCATVGPKAISIFVVLGQYRGCAALAIVGWYFFNAFGQGYFSNFVMTTYCQMAKPPLGLGFTAYNQYLYVPSIIGVIVAFVIPFAIGSGRFQLKGYCTIMCICNLLYAGATAISWGVPLSAGSAKPNSDESSAFCSSVAWFFVVNILFQVATTIYSVTSIAAIVSWFGGKRSKWIPAALAAREIMNQLGSLASNEVFDLDVFKLANGNFAPILCIAFELLAAGLLILAHKVSDCVNGPKAEMRRAAARASEGLPAHSLEDVLTTGELAEMVAVKPLGSAAMLGLPDVVKGADVPAAGVGV
ncbi:hypothetical protein HKI87_02g14550 [Chloropicon roscoffensis]|uniref:Uncharacterized protein n=1 Tax=Chloropicon roscoffensis TaxID=1461544 RepID=A0AAX4P229_9CHLO